MKYVSIALGLSVLWCANAGVVPPTLAQNAGFDETAEATPGVDPSPATGPAAAGTTLGAKDVDAVSRDTFSSLVVADLPPVLSRRFSELAARLSSTGGVSLAPAWWSLDMAAFSAKTPFNGKALAEKLGLTIISDVSDDLILAAADSPSAVRAEARLFLKRLFERNSTWCAWNRLQGNATDMNGQVCGSSTRNGRLVQLMIRRPNGRVDVINYDENGSPKADADSDWFKLEGALADEKVMCALGLVADDLKRPMAHYKLSDFFVKNGAADAGNDERMAWRGYYNGNGGEEQPKGLIVYAGEGAPQTNVPDGPKLDLGLSTDAVAAFLGSQLGWWWMANRFNPWGYYYGQTSRTPGPKTADNPTYVAVSLQDFAACRVPDAGLATSIEKELKTLGDAPENADRVKALRRTLSLERDRTLHPRRMVWVDAGGVELMRDEVDMNSPSRAARRTLAERTGKMLRSYTEREGVGADYPTGRLGDYSLKQKYGIDWNYFEVAPYDDDLLEIQQESTPELKHCMLVRTIKDCQAPEFVLRVDRQTGTIEWVSGEPESEEMILGRRKEVARGVELLLEALQRETGATGVERDIDWIARVFSQAAFAPRFTTAADFSVMRLLPGVIKVSGQTVAGDSRQSVLFDADTRAVMWETRRTVDAPVQSNPYGCFDD